MKAIVAISVLALFFVGCGTIPESSIHMLSAPSSATALSSPRIRVMIPEYIDQSALVLRLEDGSFHQANYHRWGESLEEGIARLVGSRLASVKREWWEDVRIELSLEQFHAAESGDVFLRGMWRISLGKDEGFQDWIQFDATSSIEESGYEAAVRAMGDLVSELASEILGSL